MIGSMYTVGELAKRMRVSVRTLQYYDRKMLLRPSAHSEGGRRLYDSNDVIKLQQILSLKYIGLSLDEIREYLAPSNGPLPITDILDRQIKALADQKNAIENSIEAMRMVLREMQSSSDVDLDKVAHAIFTLRLIQDGHWFSLEDFNGDSGQHGKPDHRTESNLKTHIEGQSQADAGFPLRLAQQYEQVMSRMFDLVRKGVDPASPEGQEAACELWALVTEFTGGNMALLPQLMEFGESQDGWPDYMKERQEVIGEFMGVALSVYRENHTAEVVEARSSEAEPAKRKLRKTEAQKTAAKQSDPKQGKE